MWFLQLFTLDKNLFIKLIDNKGEVYTIVAGDEVDDDDDEISVKSKQGDNLSDSPTDLTESGLGNLTRSSPMAPTSSMYPWARTAGVDAGTVPLLFSIA